VKIINNILRPLLQAMLLALLWVYVTFVFKFKWSPI